MFLGGCRGGAGVSARGGGDDDASPSRRVVRGGGGRGEGIGGACVWNVWNSFVFCAIQSRMMSPLTLCGSGTSGSAARARRRRARGIRSGFPFFLRSFATPARPAIAITASARTGRSAAASSTTCATRFARALIHFPSATATCAALALSSRKWIPRNASLGGGCSRSHHAAPSARTSGSASRSIAQRSMASARRAFWRAHHRAVLNPANTPRFVTPRLRGFPSAGATAPAMDSTSLVAARLTASWYECESEAFASASFRRRFMECRNQGSSRRRRRTARSSSSACDTRYRRTRAARTSRPCAGVSWRCLRACRLA